MAGERKQVAVTGDDEVGLSQQGAFENPIVRLIRENMKVRLGLQDRRCLTDRREKLRDLLIRPVELVRRMLAVSVRMKKDVKRSNRPRTACR